MKIKKIRIADIEVDDEQPRKDIINVGELASSIVKEGLMQPIEVRQIANNRYKIIDGERRYSAYKLLKKEEIECIVTAKKDVFFRQLISDFQKEKLNLVEQSDAINKLLKQMTFEEIQRGLGLSRSKIYLLRKIARFNNNTRKMIIEGKLTQNILANLSEDTKEKEDVIVQEILRKRAKTKSQITDIIMNETDIRYVVNIFLTELYNFEKRVDVFNNFLRTTSIDAFSKENIRTNENSLFDKLKQIKKLTDDILESKNE